MLRWRGRGGRWPVAEHTPGPWLARPIPLPLSPAREALFWSKVEMRGPDECWPWLARRHEAGYGLFHIGRRAYRAHRLAFALSTGASPARDLMICHSCDYPPCCNPLHLFAGTPSDNTWDAYKKGRVRPSVMLKGPHYNTIKTDCKRGHHLSGDNLRVRADGHRCCVTCHRLASRERKRRLRAHDALVVQK